MAGAIPAQHSSPAAWVRLLLAVAAAQALFWLVFDPLIYGSPSLDGKIEITRMEVATLASPDAAAIAAARPRTVKPPWSDCCSGGYRLVRYHFTIDSIPRDGFVASSAGVADNLEIYVNGQLAFTHGRMDRNRPTYHGSSPQYFSLPAALFHTGDNTIDAVLVRSKMPWFDAGKLVVGPRAALIAAYDRRNWVLNDFAMISIGVGVILALLALVIGIRSHDRAIALWTALATTAWVMWSLHYYVDDPPFTPAGRIFNYFAWINLVPFAWLGLVNAWTGQRSRIFIVGIFGVYAAVLMASWWAIHHGGEGGFDLASDISSYVGLIVVAVALLNFLWHFRRGADLRVAESAILTVCLTILACERWWELLWDQVFGRIRTASIPILLIFVIAFLARNVRLFQSQEQINTLLSAQLVERTAELEAAHLREKELVRAKAHQSERQRILRDMHDGLGSQLMSMLLAARRGVAKPAAVAEGLQSVIDEMRLLIDSMDSVGESLGSAFALFRDRVRLRTEEAGMAFDWQDSTGGALPDLGPREVLQVFRVMQEAVTNALKHSGGTRVTVSVSRGTAPAAGLRIAIADNGAGLREANPRGKGMESMAARAAVLGGTLDVQSGPEGTVVSLNLPEQAAQVR